MPRFTSISSALRAKTDEPQRGQKSGGHCEIFRDRASDVPIDIGVVIFPDNLRVRGYFARFGVPLSRALLGGGASTFVDFRTGDAVAAFNPSAGEVGAALFGYLQILATQFGFLERNGYKLPAPGAVLDQLLLPFGRFARWPTLPAAPSPTALHPTS